MKSDASQGFGTPDTQSDSPFADMSATGSAAPSSSAQPSWLNPTPPPEAPSSQPSWMNEQPAAATRQPQPAESPADEVAPVPGGPPPMDISCSQLPREIAVMRGCNIVAAFLLALLACLKLESNSDDVSSGVLSIYIFAFALILFVFEIHLSCSAKIIAENLGFMYRATGRMCFMILLGMLCFSKSPMPGLGIFVGLWVVVTALFNGFIFFKHPEYERSCRIVDLQAE